MPEIRVRLGLEEYRDLVRGRVVDVKAPEGNVKIILADLGWDVLAEELARAEYETGGGRR